MKFCLDDGSLLVEELEPTRVGSGAEATLHLSDPSSTQPASKPVSTQQSTMTSVGFQPAGGVSPDPQIPAERSGQSSRGLLWVVIALIIGGSGIAIALIVMRGRQPDGASVSQNANSIASPAPTLNSSEAGSPSVQSKVPVNAAQKGTPLPNATPLKKPTPVKADVREEQPSPPATPRGPISGGVMNGKAVRLVQPAYPAIAKAAHVSGTVTVQVLVDENGNVISARAVTGHPLLHQSAVAAAKASKFSPTKLSGQPVKVSGVIIYDFQAQ